MTEVPRHIVFLAPDSDCLWLVPRDHGVQIETAPMLDRGIIAAFEASRRRVILQLTEPE